MLLSRKHYVYIIAAIASGWAVYCFNPFALYFQNDDFTNILLASKHVLFQRNSFRPVCDLSIMLDYTLWGTNAAGYHFNNLLLHMLASVLVYFFSKKILVIYHPLKETNFFAFIAAVLFFIYPLHSEGVFWILGRSGTLGAIFSITCLLFFIKEKPMAKDNVACALFYVIALFTYESSWLLPLIAAVLVAGLFGWASVIQRWRHFLVAAIIFIGYLFLRWKQNSEVLGDYEAHSILQFNAGALAQNFAQLIIRSFTTYQEAPVLITAGFISVFVITAILFFKSRKASKAALYVVIAFCLSLLPYLSLGIDTHGTGGERFLYLPSAFVCLLIAIVLANAPPKLTAPVFCIVCIVYMAQLYVNAGNYKLAGKVVKQTVDALIHTATSKPVQIEGLPRAQHGAMILESGLPHAAELLNMKLPVLQIMSLRSELLPLQAPYKTVNQPAVYGGQTRFVYTDTALMIYAPALPR